MYRTGLWTLWERERVGRFGRMALKKKKRETKQPIIIKSLDFYCKERIIAPESSDHAFPVAQREFQNSELIRQ